MTEAAEQYLTATRKCRGCLKRFRHAAYETLEVRD